MNVSKVLFAMLMALFSCLIALAQTTFKTYHDQELGYSIGYPDTWQVSPQEDNSYIIIKPPAGSPQAEETAVEIIVNRGVENNIEEAVADIVPKIIGQFASGTELSRRDAMVAGKPAKIVTIKVVDQQQNDVTIQLAFVLNAQDGYVLFLESLTSKLSSNQATLDRMLASFRFVATGRTSNTNNTSSHLTLGSESYQNTDQGYSILYPEGWQAIPSEKYGTELVSIEPLGEDPKPLTVILLVDQVHESLETFLDYELDFTRSAHPDIEILSEDDVSVSGNAGKQLTISYKEDDLEITQTKLLVMTDKSYMITINCRSSEMTMYQELINDMLTSFTLTDSAMIPAAIEAQSSGHYGALKMGETREGILAAANVEAKELVYHTYTIEVPAGLAELTIQATGQDHDIDMAVKIGSEITSYDESQCLCDFKDFSDDPSPAYTLSNPQAGLYFIDVVNYQGTTAPYSISLSSRTSTTADNPLSNKAAEDHFSGRFAGEGLVLELSLQDAAYVGTLSYNEQIFPVIARAEGTILSGTFESQGNKFDFRVVLEGTLLSLETGGVQYTLEQQAVPKNPLGN